MIAEAEGHNRKFKTESYAVLNNEFNNISNDLYKIQVLQLITLLCMNLRFAGALLKHPIIVLLHNSSELLFVLMLLSPAAILGLHF